MSESRRQTFLLAALAVVAIVAAVLLYLLLEVEKPEEGYESLLGTLINDVLPSLIATLLTAIFALLFANYLYREHAQKVRAKDLSPGLLSIAGSWKLRDWRHDYGEEFEASEPKPAPPDDADWYRRREAFCVAEERDDRSWKHSENVRIDQTGDFVEVYFSHRDSDRKRWVRYRIEGRLLGRVFTGEWREIFPKGEAYWFGTVQLLVVSEGDRKHGKAMLGRWTGSHSNGGRIRSGVWEFIETGAGKQEVPWPSGVVDPEPRDA